MASPIGHGLLGLAAARLVSVGAARERVAWYAFAVFLANLPDLDFLPGILLGEAGRFHRSASHSILAALAVGVLAALLARGSRVPAWRFGAASFAFYASHLLLDALAEDPAAPVGQPLFWPFLSDPVISPWAPFLGVYHDGMGARAFIGSILSGANRAVIARELLVLGPVAALAWLGGRRPERGT